MEGTLRVSQGRLGGCANCEGVPVNQLPHMTPLVCLLTFPTPISVTNEPGHPHRAMTIQGTNTESQGADG
jgi:hypothetical protein